jgi:glycosyltransferase involved in cell wall biosynthesis
MNIVFLSLVKIDSLNERGIYTDLLRFFFKNGHSVTIVCPKERRYWNKSIIQRNIENLRIIQVPILNLQKTHIIEKLIGTLLVEPLFIRVVKKYRIGVRDDLLLYSTPPVTFASVIKHIKKSNSRVKTYLLLKDIFPQNAVDIDLFTDSSLIHKYFRRKETTLYKVSDFIGCMSKANVNYILAKNKFLDNDRVEVCPNSIEISKSKSLNIDKVTLRKKYSIPDNVTVFIYGGNLGKPQGINFIESAIEAFEKIEGVFLFIVGSGTEFSRLNHLIKKKKLKKTLIHASLPKEDYDLVIGFADVGLIFLDYRFTIPNFPSRLLSYMENCLPVISATDESTDIGAISERANFGVCCASNSINDFIEKVIYMRDRPEKRTLMGKNGYMYLEENYTVEKSYEIIMKHFS